MRTRSIRWIDLDPPAIIDWSNKVALNDGNEIFMECRVDDHPRAEINWTGANGESLNEYADEKMIQPNQFSSELHRKLVSLSRSMFIG